MKNKIVRKANALIEASYKLTTQEQRVLFFMISLIKQADQDFADYTIPVKKFAEMAGIHHHSKYEDVREITKKLIGRVFTIYSPGEELQISWLSSAKYVEGEGKVILSFDPKLKPFLLQLKSRFTQYNLLQVMQLRSSFSIRIYELLKQFQNLGERVFEINYFRKLLGISDDQYRNFNDLKRFVIIVAQEELYEKTDVSFEFEEIKVGRSVGKLRFFIKTNQKPQNQEIEDAAVLLPENIPDAIHSNARADLDQLRALLPGEYQTKESVLKILREFLENQGFDYVARNIKYANGGSNAVNPGVRHGKGSNYRNYLAKALKGDFGLASKEDQEASREQEEKARQEKEVALAAANQERNRAQLEQEDMTRARIYRENLAPEAQEALREEALARMDQAQQDLVARKSAGSELLLKIAMDKICMERMKLV